MQSFLLVLAGLFFLVGFVSMMIIVVDAFRYEWWAGLLALFFLPYLIYWSFFEFEHDRKWPVLIGCFVGIFLAALFVEFAMGVPVVRRGSLGGFG